MVVFKFGGTSVQNLNWIDKALTIIENRLDEQIVLVSSAMATVTNKIIEISKQAEKGEREKVSHLIDALEKSHIDILASFLEGEALNSAKKTLAKHFSEFRAMCTAISLTKKIVGAMSDFLLSYGERLACFLIYHRALFRSIDAELLFSPDFIKTDDTFGSAKVDYEKTYPLICKKVKPKNNKLIITQGFIASTDDGLITTLGRSGSDYTAALIGAALKAEEIVIWTDVDGILTGDPRFVDSPKLLETVSYEEAGELAAFGAKVVHPATMKPSVELNIPIHVKNTGNPESKGTLIQKESFGTGLKAITGKKNITVLSLTSFSMLNAYGYLSEIFSVFEKQKTSVDLIATSELTVSMTIEDERFLPSIIKDLEKIGTVKVTKNLAIISLIGDKLDQKGAFFSQLFKIVDSNEVLMGSFGSNQINFSLLVKENLMQPLIKTLHSHLLA